MSRNYDGSMFLKLIEIDFENTFNLELLTVGLCNYLMLRISLGSNEFVIGLDCGLKK